MYRCSVQEKKQRTVHTHELGVLFWSGELCNIVGPNFSFLFQCMLLYFILRFY